MSLGILALETVRGRIEFDVPGEFLFVCLLILLGQVPLVVGHELLDNVCSVNICFEGFGLAVISRESLF